ncbi:MAG TPA: ATP-binding protein [Thermodesulfobacteriota bacterium]
MSDPLRQPCVACVPGSHEAAVGLPPERDWLAAGASALGRLIGAGVGDRSWGLLAAILDAVPDGVQVVDREHRTLYENRAFRERFADAARASQYFEGDVRTDLGVECPAASVLVDGLPHEVVRESQLADGERAFLEFRSTPLFDGDSRLVGVLTVVRDETRRVWLERERAGRNGDGPAPVRAGATALALERERQRYAARLEQAVEARTAQLHRAKETLQQILDGIPDAIALLDSSSGATLFRNRAAESLPHDIRRAIRDAICTSCEIDRLRSHTSARLVEHVDAQGRLRVLEAFAYPVAGMIEGRTLDIVFARDITERRALEQHAIRNERLAVVGELAAGLAHEIRTPLTSISNSVKLLEGLLPRDSSHDARLVLGIIAKESKRLSGLLTDFLKFARPRPPEPRATDLNGLVRSVVEIVRTGRPHAARVQVALDLAERLPLAPVDPDQFQQALLNVVVNAFDAAQDAEAAQVTIRTKGPGDGAFGWSITVSDTGPGIDPADLPRLFEPFFSKGKCDGTGLGLAIAKRIVEAHAGRIEVTSVPGEGAAFTVILPAASGSAPLEGA